MTRAGIVAVAAMVVAGAGTWVVWQDDAASSVTAPQPEPQPLDGASVFMAKGCAVCHDGPDSTTPYGINFPSLVDAHEWADERDPALTAEEYIRQSITDPGVYISPQFTAAVGPTDGMPTLDISPAELDALVDHLLQRAASTG